MIEKLMDQELPYGEPSYSDCASQITLLRKTLEGQLDQDGIAALEQLSNYYTRQSNAVAKDVFQAGFCAAVDVMIDYIRRKGTISREPPP